MNKILFPFFLLIYVSVSSQITFQKGYYLDNTNSRIEGYIKNEEWLSAPKSIKFKKQENATEVEILSKDLVEFEVYDEIKYKKFLVKIYNTKLKIGDNRKPTFEEQELLLSTLVEGELSLYETKGGTFTTYFMQDREGKTLQLINFKVELPNNKVALLSTFKEDLKLFISCSDLKNIDYDGLNYNSKSLINFVVSYNSCKNGESKLFNFNSKKIKLHLIPKIGFSYNSLSMENKQIGFKENLSGMGYYVGSEIEFSLPFNRRKWSIIAEPSYITYSASKSSAQNNSGGISTSDSRFQLGFGLRHYLYMEQYQLYLTGRLFMPLSANKNVEFSSFDDSTDFKYKSSISFGIGARIKKRFYTELNLGFKTNEAPKFNTTNMDYSTFTAMLTLGYQIL